MNKTLLNTELQLLAAVTDDVCISVIMPTHRYSSGRSADLAEMDALLENVKVNLQKQYDAVTLAPLLLAMDDLYEQIEYTGNASGIGLFISAGVKKLIPFFFPVTEKITIGQQFDLRCLAWEAGYDVPYVLLQLSQQEARLYNGRLHFLTEITDADFPRQNDDLYEYQRHSRGNSNTGHSFVKEIDTDRSVMEAIRFRNFLRETDKLLNGYLGYDTPLIVTGENKDLSGYRQITTHKENIACSVPGNYSRYSDHELGALIWQAMKEYLDNKKERFVKVFGEKKGAGLAVTGLDNCWRAVQEGRGLLLLVEKDYAVPGYLPVHEDYDLVLHEPRQVYRRLPDAVNSLMALVLQKKGQVILVDNEVLRDHRRVALIMRY